MLTGRAKDMRVASSGNATHRLDDNVPFVGSAPTSSAGPFPLW